MDKMQRLHELSQHREFFFLRPEWRDKFDGMPLEQCGMLWRAVVRYCEDETITSFDNGELSKEEVERLVSFFNEAIQKEREEAL